MKNPAAQLALRRAYTDTQDLKSAQMIQAAAPVLYYLCMCAMLCRWRKRKKRREKLLSCIGIACMCGCVCVCVYPWASVIPSFPIWYGGQASQSVRSLARSSCSLLVSSRHCPKKQKHTAHTNRVMQGNFALHFLDGAPSKEEHWPSFPSPFLLFFFRNSSLWNQFNPSPAPSLYVDVS